MLSGLQPAVDYAATEFARVQTELARADGLELSGHIGDRERAAAMKALAYVWCSATLEQYVKKCLEAVISDLQSRSLLQQQLRPSVCSLLHVPHFDSYVNRKKLGRWEKACEIMEGPSLATPAVFGDHLPLDGKTLRRAHFDTIWRVFGFSGDSLRSPRHSLALEDLADGRNDIAHGKQDPVTFGRTKAIRDVRRLVTQIEDQVLHLAVAADRYLTSGDFLR